MVHPELAKKYFEKRHDRSKFDLNRDIEAPAMIEMMGPVKDKVVLDIGCGFGYHAKILSKQNFKALIGLDVSSDMIKFASEQNIPKTKFIVYDVEEELEYEDESFDVVYSSLTLHYIQDQNKLFKEVHRVLKEDGIFVVSTSHPIFNLINQSKIGMIGVTKTLDGRHSVLGNYFDEAGKEKDFGEHGKIKFYNYTFESLILAGLNNGFELIDYRDAKPIPESKEQDEYQYKLANTLPTFTLFKFRKK